jgi:DNA-binding transcriptional MerR regulator
MYVICSKGWIIMKHNSLFAVKDFAKFSRTTKDTLLYYDRIGLLSPEMRGENKYRYYSSRLLATINVIRTLQRLGMSLEEIKNLKDHRTPEFTVDLFARQIEKIDEKIEEWIRARKLLLTLSRTIHNVANIDEKAITIQFIPAEAIILGGLNDYSRGKNDYDALLSFYDDISEKYPELDLNYPVWGTYSGDRIRQGDWVWPDRYYFYNPEGHDRKPAALYATGYTRGGYGDSNELYKRLIKYIDDNGFEICGDAYEEYPLNEICVLEEKDYLMRIMITVKRRE